MKKNLLTLSFLVACISTYAQDTYIGDKAIVKVQPNTLFYNGGNVKLAPSQAPGTALTNIVLNEGNIQIEGDFKNEISSINSKEFINVWNSSDSYGQLNINDTKDAIGNIAMERSLPNVSSIDEYIIALPFQSSVKDVFNSFTSFYYTGAALPNSFKGDCQLNTNCGANRYTQSMLVWDNNETEYDAVVESDLVKPYQRYILNTRNNSNLKKSIADLSTFFNNNTGLTKKVAFSGVPSNNSIDIILNSGLKNNNQSYEDKTFSQWKNSLNNYNETYNSYLSNQLNTASINNSKLFGKNIHRLANPYTSNLDLSDISRENTWIKFNMNGDIVSPTDAYTGIRFRIFKLANDFSITWNNQTGNTSTQDNTTSFNAFLSKDTSVDNTVPYFWTGSPAALLIKPYETFYIDYYALNRSVNGNTRMVEAQVKLGDNQKTFIQSYSSADPTSIPGVYARSNNKLNELLNDENLKNKGLVTDFDFTQLELFLSENSVLKGSAAYLLNANFMTTGNETADKITDNPVFFYEENQEGDVIATAETMSNYFNSEDYIGKPLRIGFKNLTIGNEYQINMNLYEYSILNKVEGLSLGRYFLLDKLNNSVKEIDASTQVNFIADQNSNDRFEFYWNESPKTLSTSDLANNTTYVYKNNNSQYVKFEKNNTTATIEVYDVTGRLISNALNIQTNSDYKLNLSNVPNIYIVKIIYKDGTTVTKKTINK